MKKQTKTRLTKFLALAAVAPFVLTACGGGGNAASGDATSLTILDYYNNDPDKGLVQTAIDKCAADIGVTINREAVPGKDLIQKVLQQSSSKTLPDVLMLDNPDVQEIAATGGLAPLSDFGIDTSGFAQGMLDAGTLRGRGLRPGSDGQHPRPLLQQGPPGRGRADTAHHLGRAEDSGREADHGRPVRLGLQRHRHLRGRMAVPAVHVDQRRRRDRPEQPRGSRGPAALEGPGRARFGVQERHQLGPGRRQRPVHGRQGRHDDQRPVADPGTESRHLPRMGIRPGPGQQGRPDPRRPAGWRGLDRPGDRRQGQAGQGRRVRQCITAATRTSWPWRRPALHGSDQDRRWPSSTSQDAGDGRLHRAVANARSRTGKLGEEWPEAATDIYTAIQLALTGQGHRR